MASSSAGAAKNGFEKRRELRDIRKHLKRKVN
jgi:hypothetical protein